MNERIRLLIRRLNEAEEELRTALHEQETRIDFRIIGKRIQFRDEVMRRHRELRTGLLRWLGQSQLRNVISAPFIYAVLVPLLVFDAGVTSYQAICFPLYRIAKVRRSQQLGYLNFLERLHCTYCAYANGLIAYAREIAARTEQYWCPIKHARKVLGTHARYARFLDYGDAQDFRAQVARLRAELAAEKAAAP